MELEYPHPQFTHLIDELPQCLYWRKGPQKVLAYCPRIFFYWLTLFEKISPSLVSIDKSTAWLTSYFYNIFLFFFLIVNLILSFILIKLFVSLKLLLWRVMNKLLKSNLYLYIACLVEKNEIKGLIGEYQFHCICDASGFISRFPSAPVHSDKRDSCVHWR